jgi:hypothetical protein
MYRNVVLRWCTEAVSAAIDIVSHIMGTIWSAAIVYQLSYRCCSAHVETQKRCEDKQLVTVVLKVQYSLQLIVSSKKGAGIDLLTRDSAFTSMMRTTADEITALKATVCREWQMSRHVPDFGAF